MVGKVLTGNGITCYGNGAYSLIGDDELSDCGTWPKASVAEPLRDELLQLCRQRLDGFRAQQGEDVASLLVEKPAASATAAATARRAAAQQPAGPLLPLQWRQARSYVPTQVRSRKQLFKFIPCLLNISEDFGQQARPKRFARVDWDNSGAPVWMPEEMMATLNSLHNETSSLKSGNQCFACNRRVFGHS